MAWGLTDDKLHSHRKTLRIPRANRCEAMGLWTLVNSWCNDHGTDGNVPRDIWDEFGTTLGTAELLVAAGFWETTEDGYQVVNWAEYNKTSAQLAEKRQAEADRKAKWRATKKGQMSSSEDSPADVPRDSHVSPETVTPASALTHTHTHTPKDEELLRSSSTSAEPPRPDIEELCERLQQRITETGSKTPTITAKWRTEARLLLDRDKRDLGKALALIDWALADDFWRGNIASMPTFRKQYDRLRIKANAEAGYGPASSTSASAKVAGWGEIAQQADAIEAAALTEKETIIELGEADND
ncbi:hypothetical protein ACKAMS_24710 [Rhodococcus sp. 5A-K4]|uniref:hypothetical protein n=1 Tax=Rhodococcus sp. 5A-K4 TaxID=3384442 RepID=UPI0038D355AB